MADFPDEQNVLDVVAGMPAAAATRYWATRTVYLRSDDQVMNDEIARKLVGCQRAVELINQSLKKLSIEMAIVVLEAAVRELQQPHHIDAMLGYNVKETFKWLRGQPDAPHDRISAVEHSFLPVLLVELRDGEQLTFHKTMADRPESFVAMLCDAFRPAKSVGGEERIPITPEAEGRATVAWRVLRSWRTPPGVDASNSVNYEPMMDWISRARRLAEEADRVAVADQFIGAVLFHTPSEADGRWPSDDLAHALDELRSKAIEDGLSMEVFNSRGTTSRGILDGGTQEGELAEQWASRATQLPEKRRRTKRLCQRIADSWRQMAKDFDVDAAKRRLNF